MSGNEGRKLFSVEKRAIGKRSAGGDEGAIDPSAVAGMFGLGGGDSGEVLKEIAALRSEISELTRQVKSGEFDHHDEEVQQDIRVEIAQMVRSIGRAKQEIAAIKHPQSSEDHMETASKQLEAIVETTEEATNGIMTATDDIEDILEKIKSRSAGDEDIEGLADDALGKITTIIESCSFQDLTGQRINEVVKTLRFIEGRILAIIDIWGLEAFQDLPVPEDDEESHEEEALLNGPALGSQGLSQEDIDALFD